jgi:hypothetical protein
LRDFEKVKLLKIYHCPASGGMGRFQQSFKPEDLPVTFKFILLSGEKREV